MNLTLKIFCELVLKQRSKVTVWCQLSTVLYDIYNHRATVHVWWLAAAQSVYKLSMETVCKNSLWIVHGVSQTRQLCWIIFAGVHTWRGAGSSMAVGTTAMGPVLVHGRQVTSGVLAGHCSKKGRQADRRSYVLEGVSLFVAADRTTSQASFWQVSLFPPQAGFQQEHWTSPADLLWAGLVVQQELVF